jgi:hypothetical protein
MSFPRLTGFSRLATVTAVGVVAAGAFAATSLASSTSHAVWWQDSSGKVSCGIEIHGKAPAKYLLCSATPIPAPKHSNPADGDPGFVQLAKTGKPQLLRLSQDSFIGKSPVTLHKGSKWSGVGVTCTIAATTVKCTNSSGHGIEIYGPGKSYKSF